MNDANFRAVFSINHVGHLNSVNPGMDLGLGQIVSGNWDDDGGATPDFTWGIDNSINQVSLLQNVQNIGGFESISHDATSVVRDWVLNDSNQGFALFGYEDGGGGNPTNGSYLSDASLQWEIIPEPSAGILALFGAFALFLRRFR